MHPKSFKFLSSFLGLHHFCSRLFVCLMLLVVLVVGDIDFIADFDGFIGYATNVLLKIFGLTSIFYFAFRQGQSGTGRNSFDL